MTDVTHVDGNVVKADYGTPGQVKLVITVGDSVGSPGDVLTNVAGVLAMQPPATPAIFSASMPPAHGRNHRVTIPIAACLCVVGVVEARVRAVPVAAAVAVAVPRKSGFCLVNWEHLRLLQSGLAEPRSRGPRLATQVVIPHLGFF
jgi:hypothetical protein